MAKSKAQLDLEIAQAKRDELQAICDAARETARVEPTIENRARAIAAWDALVAATPRMKRGGGFGSRAGQRQAAERKAEAAERATRRRTR